MGSPHCDGKSRVVSARCRTYRDEGDAAKVVLIPRLGLESLSAGTYLIHTEHEGGA
jgi:hypothetical protein